MVESDAGSFELAERPIVNLDKPKSCEKMTKDRENKEIQEKGTGSSCFRYPHCKGEIRFEAAKSYAAVTGVGGAQNCLVEGTRPGSDVDRVDFEIQIDKKDDRDVTGPNEGIRSHFGSSSIIGSKRIGGLRARFWVETIVGLRKENR